MFNMFTGEILGLEKSQSIASEGDLSDDLIEIMLKLRQEAKQNKDWATADNIRNQLSELGIIIKDTKDGFEWKKA
jgi:cysteinyl-tRNA synthetase